MKKVTAILICLAMLLSLAACGGSSGEPGVQPQSSSESSTSQSAAPAPSAAASEPEAPAEPSSAEAAQSAENSEEIAESVLELGKVNSQPGECDFSLRKTVTTDIVACNPDRVIHKLYQDPEHIYVDVVFDWTNTGTDIRMPYEVMTASASAPDGTEIAGEVYIEAPDMEGHPHASMSMLDEMAPGEAQVLHAIFLTGSDTESLSMKFTVQDHVYTYEYTLGDIVTNAEELKPGDVLESDMAKLEFIGIGYTDELVPVNKGNGSYYSINVQGVDEAISTMLDAKFRLTSKLDSEQDSKYFLYMNAKYGDDLQTYYESNMPSTSYYETVGWDGLPGFESNIVPEETFEIHYLITTLEDNMDRPLALFLEFDGKEYIYREN